MRTTRRQAIVTLSLLVAHRATAAAHGQAPTPRPPSVPSGGGFSPFRQKGFAGTSIAAAALEQPGCPLVIQVTGLNRSEREVTLSTRLNNLGEDRVTRQAVGTWVLVPDGTVRGYQNWVGERDIEPAQYRAVDLIVRATVMPDDVIIVAIQEAIGNEIALWRRETEDLQREILEVIKQAQRSGR